MFEDDRVFLAALLHIPGVGPKLCAKLQAMATHEGWSIAELWNADSAQLLALGCSSVLVERWLATRSGFDIQRFAERLRKESIAVVTIDDLAYPQLLREIPYPPPLLYVKGVLPARMDRVMAVVGTRKVTSYGRFVTKQLVSELVEVGFTIVSGFMYGVDAVAHQTALERGGVTIGVLGFGFDTMYPAHHHKLAKEVLARGGALVSEFPPATPAHPGNFPARNRLVAGMSLGVLVTEAAKDSGSKITAQFAGEYGREVFSVAGAITSIYSEGTKDLVNSGAKLVTNAQDILAEFPRLSGVPLVSTIAAVRAQLDHPVDQRIVDVLAAGPLRSDDLARSLNLDIAVVSARLTRLELMECVVCSGGSYGVV